MSQAATTEMWTMMKTRHLQRSKELEMKAIMTQMKDVGCRVDMTIRIENKRDWYPNGRSDDSGGEN